MQDRRESDDDLGRELINQNLLAARELLLEVGIG
jgi:hypothetical protein